ncbi:glycosyltransferase family 2 protein [Micromonospora sp. NBC_01796]|uniref:glycosyltransferase family 2 protein n=1 Tax=Micromonospora sp. NBC_01796 TaxID=2975987 RepID=UPI002DD7A2CB|nr:glycosyltransferase family 2 protein [Micromonospora sp. NBC_01796]WSA84235.1 glycosyltransferase family 2 protein [Micromonospora sp. NBC_01796]
MTTPAATAVIVTYNSANHIDDCLAALTQADLVVRVVDNDSADRTVALVTERFPKVEVIANPVNVGFAAAVNQGLAGVDTDVVLLVNPDCVLPAATARELVRTVRAGPDVGIAGPRLRDPVGRVAISAHPFESLSSVLASRFGGALLPVALRRLLSGTRRRRAYDACTGPAAAVAVDWLSGACLAVRTRLMREIGGLDEGYFMYYEDEELCLQAWRRGAAVVYVPMVEAMHVGGASSGPGATSPHLYRSMLRFFARHRRRSFQLVRLAVVLRSLIGMGLAAARWVGSSTERTGWRGRAWFEVCRIALSTTPDAAAREQRKELRRPQCT